MSRIAHHMLIIVMLLPTGDIVFDAVNYKLCDYS